MWVGHVLIALDMNERYKTHQAIGLTLQVELRQHYFFANAGFQ